MSRATWLSKRPGPPSLTATQVALRFVAEIQAGQRPSIEAALDQAPAAEWTDLLPALLIAEINARRSRGEHPIARDYLARFPAHTDVVRGLVPDETSPSGVVVPESPAVLVELERDLGVPKARSAPRRRRRRWWLAAVALIVVGAATPFILSVRHWRPRSAEQPPPPSAPASPVSARNNTPTLFPKAATTDPERDLAEWVVARGGRGTVLPDGASRRPFGGDAPLPKTRFAVTAIILPPEAAGRWTPADLERLRGRSRLVGVQLHSAAALTAAALAPLAGLPLRSLELDGGPVRASGRFFATFPDLEVLALPSCPDFSDTDLAAIGRLGKLSVLRLNAPKLTVEGFRELRTPGLKALTLGPDVGVTPEHVRLLQRLPLEEFEAASAVSDEAFVEFALFPEVRRIRLHNAPLTDPALRAVAGLGKLEELRLVGSSVTGGGLDHVAERTGLKVLDLSGGKVSNTALGTLLGLPALKELRLAGNPITDEGVVFLAQLDGIEVLDLGATGMTDAGLGALKKHPTLKTLIATNTRLTGPAVAEFESATPNCKVVFGRRR